MAIEKFSIETEIYHHHKLVHVQPHLKGLHRQYCLCFGCHHFHPDDRDLNCKIANILFRIDQIFSVTTPVWECAEFDPIGNI